MRVLLVFPNMKIRTGEPPLGIAYIASYLRERGVDVNILDSTFNNSFSFIEKTIKQKKPDVLGISTITTMINDANKVAEIGKSYGIPLVVFGGPHPSVEPEKTLENNNVDAVIIGEGEYSFYKIIEAFEKRESITDLKGIPNVYVKCNRKIERCKKRHFIKDLDTIPFPARDLLDMENYFKHWFQLDVFSSRLRGTNVYTMGSCPFSCTFCQPTLKIMFGNLCRRRSPKNVIDELKYLKEKYRINSFFMGDDLFMINRKYIEELCEKMINEKLDLIWKCQTRADTVPNSQLIKKMWRAGLRVVDIGIESGSGRILKLYKKNINLSQVERTVKTFKKHQIKTRGYFILGAPTETIKEIKQTISYAIYLKLNEAVFSILCPFPGTILYEMSKKMGWELTEKWTPEYYYSKGGFIKGVLSEKIIRRYQRLAFLEFYLHPDRTMYLLNSALGLKRALTKLKCYFF